MTETGDSFAVSEQTAAESTPESEPAPEMGMGINDTGESTPAPASEPEKEQPAESAPESVDNLELSEDEQKAGYLRQADYTRKTQDLADERRKFEAERSAFYATQEQWLAQQKAQTEALERIAPPPDSTDPVDLMIQQIMQQGGTPEQQRDAIDGLRMVQNLYQQQQQPLLDKISALEAQVESFGKTAISAAERQAEADKIAIQGEFTAADEKLGAERVNQALEFVQRNYGVLGPNGERLTVTDLVARYHNLIAEDRANGQEQQLQQQRAAKNTVTLPSQAGPTDGGGF